MKHTTAAIVTDGLKIEAEPVPCALTIHGQRGARVYVRIRPYATEPGIDAGLRNGLTLTPAGAHAFGALLQAAACRLDSRIFAGGAA